jgi:hypothetical protein
LAIEKVVVSEPRVISSCLPISTISMSLVGDQLAAALLGPDPLQLALGRRLGQEVVDPGLAGDRGRGQRVVAGDHDGADAPCGAAGRSGRACPP